MSERRPFPLSPTCNPPLRWARLHTLLFSGPFSTWLVQHVGPQTVLGRGGRGEGGKSVVTIGNCSSVRAGVAGPTPPACKVEADSFGLWRSYGRVFPDFLGLRTYSAVRTSTYVYGRFACDSGGPPLLVIIKPLIFGPSCGWSRLN